MNSKRKIVYVEFYSPWLCGGYSINTINGNNDLFEAVAFVISETDSVYNLALGESQANYLHEIRLPKACIKTIIELPKPMMHPEVSDSSKN
jgi:hypothetical protein